MATGEAVQEHRCEMEEESESGEFECTDDSDDDPSFDIVEETRSAISELSIKKPRVRRCKLVDVNLEREPERESVGDEIPKLDKKDEKSFEKIEQLIKAGVHLEKLTLDQCKVYLRKYGLRLTGNKGILISRIREHQEIIDGYGEKKYPQESFVFNCKGDACLGDVVIFEQNVYEGFSIASRSATSPPCGTRTVAGRIIKESYGVAKQQHTFTIEVLWSKGVKPWPPLHQLLIKGRNLYRIKTMRQRWIDEGERIKVLQEKHGRGSRARYSREIRIQDKEKRKKGTVIKRKKLTGNHIPADKENQHPRKADVQQMNILNNKQHKHEQEVKPNVTSFASTQQIVDGAILQQPLQSILGKQMNILNSKQHKHEQEVKPKVTNFASTQQIVDGAILQQPLQGILGKKMNILNNNQHKHEQEVKPNVTNFASTQQILDSAILQQPLQSILGKPLKTAEYVIFSAQASAPQSLNSQNFQYMKHDSHDHYHQARNSVYVRPHHVHQHHYKAKPHEFHGGHLQHNQHKNYSHHMNQTSWMNQFIYVPLQQQYPEFQRQLYHYSSQGQ